MKVWLTITHEGRIGGVRRSEAASADQRNAHGGEVGGAGIGEFAVALGRVDTNGVSPTVAVERVIEVVAAAF